MDAQRLKPEELEQVKLKLQSKKSKDRESAAKKIGKLLVYEMKNELFNAFIKEIKDTRTLDAQMMMIRAIGRLDIKEALPIIEDICFRKKDSSLVLMEAVVAYIRLKRERNNDITLILNFLELAENSEMDGKYPTSLGALSVLSFDKVILEDSDIRLLVQQFEKMYFEVPPQSIDLLEYLVVAMANWKGNEFVKDYLQKSTKSHLTRVRDKANYALKGICYINEY